MKKIYLTLLLSMAFCLAFAQTDVTSKLTNADMEDNTLTGWTTDMVAQYDGNSGYATYPGFTASFMETWTGDYNTTDGSKGEDGKYYLHDHSATQTISTENGTYRLQAMVIAVQQGESANTVLEFTKGVKLFANGDSVECATYDGIPTEFSVFTRVTDGNLTIGINISNSTANWVAWDNITLTYYEMSILGSQLQVLIDKASTGMGDFVVIQDAAATELEAALDAADVYADDAAIQGSIDRLQAAYDAAVASNEAYIGLLKAIDDANSIYNAGGVGADVLKAAMDDAEEMYSNAAGDVSAVTLQTAALQAAVTEYKTNNASPDAGYDYTEYITNAEIQTNATGWIEETGTAAFQHNVAEYFNQDFTLRQNIKVPNGQYKVTVQGYYRTTGNDKGAAYAAGTENIKAYLFANEKQTPLLSMYAHTATDMGITGTDVLDGYVNMRSTANEAFTNGYYKENEVNLVVLDSTLTIGLTCTGHESNSWCAFRNFTLTYYGFNIATNLMILQDEITAFENKNFNDDPTQSNILLGMFYTLDDMLQESYNYLNDDKDVISRIYKQLDSVYKETQTSMEYYAKFKALEDEVLDLIAGTAYPGKLNLTITNNKAKGFMTADTGTYTELIDWCAQLEKAILTYRFSQPATNEAPMDATFVIKNRSFRVDQTDLDSNAVRTSEHWDYSESVYKSGDFRTYYNQGHTCWNSWSNDFTSMDVNQKITGLPAGIYAISCKALTQSGCANDQHSYIQSGVMKAISPYMTIEGWDDAGVAVSGIGNIGNGIWETLTSTKVLLTEGDTLRIGFASTHNSESGNAVNGWFCVTDFELLYYGSDDSQLFSEYMTLLDEQRGEMVLAGDKAAVDGYIATAKAAADTKEKYSAIGKAIDICNASNKAYTTFIDGAYSTMAANFENSASNYVKSIGSKTMELTDELLLADTANYKQLSELGEKLNAYGEYFIALENADQALASAENSYTAKLKDIIDEQQTLLEAALADETTLTDYAKKLTNAAADIQLSLVIEGSGNEDLTFTMVNPSVATASTGWTESVGAMAWDYNVAEFYNEVFNVFQTVMVPNGNYTVTVYGYNRPGANSPATMETASAALFYANEVEKPLLTVYDNRYEVQLNSSDYEVVVYNEDSTEVTSYYYPNNLAAAGVALIENGDYQNSIDVTVTDHRLTVGLKQETSISSSWTAFCNFGIWLNELGDNTEWIIDTKVNSAEKAPSIEVAEGVIFVNGQRADNVYGMDGKNVSDSGKLSRGIYIVRCGERYIKVPVK